MKKIKKSKKIELYILMVCVAFALIIALGVLLKYSYTPINPYGNKDAAVLVDIPTGASFYKATEILNKAGLIKSRYLFYYLAFTKRAFRSIRAGEYEFSDSMTPGAVIDKLLHGDIKTYKTVIPEDLTTTQIAEMLLKDNLIDKKEFIALAFNRDLLKTVKISSKSIKKYQLHETSYFHRSMITR